MISHATKLLMAEDYLQGFSTREVGQKHGVTGSTVLHVLEKLEVARRKGQVAYRGILEPKLWYPPIALETFTNNRTKLSYLAGIVDGEGCLLIYKRKDRRGARHFRCVLRVSNTSRRLIDWLTVSLGGSVGHYRSEDPKRLLVFHWDYEGRAAAYLLNALIPYLLIKCEVAVLMLRMQRTLNYAGTGRRLPDVVRVERDEIFELYRQEKRSARGR